VELAEIIGLRPVPCAGLLVTVTRRCPLSCSHCSTSSTLAGDQVAGASLLRFMRTLTPREHPRLVMFTGGEPLLRPGLVADLAEAARSAGTATSLLTGAFFARGGGDLPDPIRRVAAAVDHFSISIDAFHEREVARADVFTLLRLLMRSGVAVSLHIVGMGSEDPYLADVTADVRRTFGGAVPMLVSEIRAVGRASSWAAAVQAQAPGGPQPCAMAAWPVITFDGTVTACCNQDVVDGRPAPALHRLGHIDSDDWATIRTRSLSSPVLRMIRAVGPEYLRDTYLDRAAVRTLASEGSDYCGTCRALGRHPAEVESRFDFAAGPVGAVFDRVAERLQTEAGPIDFVRRHGCARYAELVALPGRAEGTGRRVAQAQP
jgi:pyruvate-formate lyase-activating enzyme